MPRRLRSIHPLAAALTLLSGAPAAWTQSDITQADLLRRVTDLQRLTSRPPAGERTLMFSSYDRASQVQPDGTLVEWDANRDAGQFLGRDADGWDVLAEVSGPGAITRIWSANPHGTIRFVLDGETVLEADFAALMAGRTPPFEAPFVYRGLNCYFPLGFAQGCRVLGRDSSMYYQVNVVQFPPGTRVQRFSPVLDDGAQAAKAEVQQTLEQGLSQKQLLAGGRAMPVAVQEDLKPGKTLREEVAGAGTVRALYVALTDRANPREPYALHRCVLRMYFDGENEPAVEAPLVDFFGAGFELTPFNSLALGTDRELPIPLPDRRTGEDRFMYCHFPMPFRNGLRVEIENLNEGRRDIGLLLVLQVDRRPPPPDALRFHARFRKEDPCAVLDYPILETAGCGRVVGCVLNVDCPRAMWWGEGDDKLWIDGEKFPSYFGTGSEDYLGDAWGLHAHIAPLQGVTRTGPYGKNSAYRWHVPDCINFQKSIRFTIENWQFGGARDTYYSTVVYWYGEPRPQPFFAPLTTRDLDVPGLRIPGAIEVEGRVRGENWGTEIKQKFAGGELSGEAAANIIANQPVWVNLPADRGQMVRLQLRTHPRRTFEAVTISASDGRLVGTVVYDRDNRDSIYDVGVLRIEPGENALEVQCSQSTMLDCWICEPVPLNPHGPEAEDLVLESSTGVQSHLEFATAPTGADRAQGRALDWSGGAQRVLNFPRPGATATFSLPERGARGAIALRLRITRSPAGGRFQVLLDDQPIGAPLETHADDVRLEVARVASLDFPVGAHTLAFRAETPTLSTGGLQLGLDAIELIPIYHINALECEELTVIAHEQAHPERQPIAGASAGEHVWCRAVSPGAWIEFAVPVEREGEYRLALVCTRSFDYGIIQAAVNGQPAGKAVDTFSPTIEAGTLVELGNYKLPAGNASVRVTVTGRNDSSTGYFSGIDCIISEPLGRRDVP